MSTGKTVTTLVQKLNFHKITITNDECFENSYLTFCRHREITALAEKNDPIKKALSFSRETFIKISKTNNFRNFSKLNFEKPNHGATRG